MRDDAEIPGQLDRHKALHYAGASSVGQSSGMKVERCSRRPVGGVGGGFQEGAEVPTLRTAKRLQKPLTAQFPQTLPRWIRREHRIRRNCPLRNPTMPQMKIPCRRWSDSAAIGNFRFQITDLRLA